MIKVKCINIFETLMPYLIILKYNPCLDQI